jgi:hypothetical protein
VNFDFRYCNALHTVTIQGLHSPAYFDVEKLPHSVKVLTLLSCSNMKVRHEAVKITRFKTVIVDVDEDTDHWDGYS